MIKSNRSHAAWFVFALAISVTTLVAAGLADERTATPAELTLSR